MKQHHIFLYILIGLSLILCLRYLGENYLSPKPFSEGFLQKENFVVKTNDEIYFEYKKEKNGMPKLNEKEFLENFDYKKIFNLN